MDIGRKCRSAIQFIVNWSALRDFLAVAEAGSLSRAARRLGVSQPTLSRRISTLERELGAHLFTRSTKGLSPTTAGERLLARVQRMQEEAVAIELETGGGEAPSGWVRVTASEGLAVEWLTAELLAFHRSYPAIRIEVIASKAPVDLLGHDADIALRLFRSEQEDLFERRVGAHALGLFAAQSYLETQGAPACAGELAHHSFVDLDERHSHYNQSTWLARHVPRERISYRSNSLLGLLAATRAGWGIGVHSCFLGHRDRRLVAILPDIKVAESDMWLVTHSDLRRSPRIRAVYDFLSDLVSTHRAELAAAARRVA